MPFFFKVLLLHAARTLKRSQKWVSLPIQASQTCFDIQETFYNHLSLRRTYSLLLTGQKYQPVAQDIAFPVPLYICTFKALCADSEMAEQRYCVDYAKRGTAGCKKCKEKILKGMVRIGKVVPNPFTESGGDMKEWYHVKCIFEKLERARATTKKIEDLTDLEGWEELQDTEKELINQHISGELLCTSHMYQCFMSPFCCCWFPIHMFYTIYMDLLSKSL